MYDICLKWCNKCELRWKGDELDECPVCRLQAKLDKRWDWQEDRLNYIIAELEAKLKRYEDALDFYADPKSWICGRTFPVEVDRDKGKRAREARRE